MAVQFQEYGVFVKSESNAEKIENKGIEAQLKSDPFESDNFHGPGFKLTKSTLRWLHKMKWPGKHFTRILSGPLR